MAETKLNLEQVNTLFKKEMILSDSTDKVGTLDEDKHIDALYGFQSGYLITPNPIVERILAGDTIENFEIICAVQSRQSSYSSQEGIFAQVGDGTPVSFKLTIQSNGTARFRTSSNGSTILVDITSSITMPYYSKHYLKVVYSSNQGYVLQFKTVGQSWQTVASSSITDLPYAATDVTKLSWGLNGLVNYNGYLFPAECGIKINNNIILTVADIVLIPYKKVQSIV